MSGKPIQSRLAYASILVAALPVGAAQAQITSSADYNHPYGMTQADQNAPVDPSLRDANGNLTLVDGQFTSSSMGQQFGLQPMGALGMSTLAASSSTSSGVSTTTTGAGFGGVGATGTATSIGNSLNVITVGSNNTVVVNSTQINNGNQSANVNLSGQ
jgi:holdfast attachment protein HfaA